MRRSAGLALALALMPSAACGGGQVDPGFTGPLPPAEDPGRVQVTRRDFERPKLVIIRARWCSACDVAEPYLASAYKKHQGQVDLVVLDVTDDYTTRHAARQAEREGVGAFFDEFRGRTPSVALVELPEEYRLVRGPLTDVDYLERELGAAVARLKEHRRLRGLD